MTTITTASANSVSTIEQKSPRTKPAHENRLSAALEHARRLTQMHGYQNVDVAIAWETVEELRSGRSHQSVYSTSCQSMFEHYCNERPAALECRSYDC